jgi:hypothetical protein
MARDDGQPPVEEDGGAEGMVTVVVTASDDPASLAENTE